MLEFFIRLVKSYLLTDAFFSNTRVVPAVGVLSLVLNSEPLSCDLGHIVTICSGYNYIIDL